LFLVISFIDFFHSSYIHGRLCGPQALVALAYLDVRLGREELGEAGGQHLYFLKLATTLCRQIGAQVPFSPIPSTHQC
jgi:hypothetical protein